MIIVWVVGTEVPTNDSRSIFVHLERTTHSNFWVRIAAIRELVQYMVYFVPNKELGVRIGM
jgi:hypothetical protein